MIEELNLFDVYVPAALMWAVLAAALAPMLQALLRRHVSAVLPRAGLVDLGLFFILWWAIASAADHWLHGAFK